MALNLLHVKWRVWFELLRLPNLFTVPGDILVGWAATGLKGAFPILAILASLAFYSVGLLLNDLFDAGIDSKERPARPIPSKRVRKRTVFLVSLCLSLFALALTLLCHAFWAGVVLLSCILFYDLIAKHIPGLGVLVMGLCRGSNIFLGAAMTWGASAVPVQAMALQHAMFFFTLYILIVSIVARNEAKPKAQTRMSMRLLPFAMVLLFYPLGWWYGAFEGVITTLVAGYYLLTAFRKMTIPQRVACYIRGLILLQGLWCLLLYPTMHMLWLILYPCLWISAWLAARCFAGS